MPGDGIGIDVMDATRVVLDALKLDAEYLHADIGWDFWCREGDALPARTIKILKETDCALFGAITSKPQTEAKEELAPELQDKGLQYFSPIVRLRQLFNLHTNLRPCKSYPGNPLNFRGTEVATGPNAREQLVDLVVLGNRVTRLLLGQVVLDERRVEETLLGRFMRLELTLEARVDLLPAFAVSVGLRENGEKGPLLLVVCPDRFEDVHRSSSGRGPSRAPSQVRFLGLREVDDQSACQFQGSAYREPAAVTAHGWHLAEVRGNSGS